MKADVKNVWHDLCHPWRAARKIVSFVFGICCTWRYIDQGCGRLRVTINPLKLDIRKGLHARIICNGVLNICPFRGGREGVRIHSPSPEKVDTGSWV